MTAAQPAPRPPAQSERQFTEAVLDFARMNGWLAAHFHDSRKQVRPGFFVGDKDAKGFPDCVFVRGVRLVFAELKVGKNKTTDAQKEWLAHLEVVADFTESTNAAANVEVHLWRDSDWPTIERVLGRGGA